MTKEETIQHWAEDVIPAVCTAEQGAEWADAHPQNPWKNVMTNKPKKGQDVFAHVPNLCGGEYCKLTYLSRLLPKTQEFPITC